MHRNVRNYDVQINELRSAEGLLLLLKWPLNLKFRFDVAKCDGRHSEKEGKLV